MLVIWNLQKKRLTNTSLCVIIYFRWEELNICTFSSAGRAPDS